MPDLKSNKYTFFFAILVCVVAGVMLSAVSEGLRHRQELNAALDVKKNILKSVALKEPIPVKATAKEVLEIYTAKIEEHVIGKDGKILEGRKPSDIKEKEDGVYPLYIYKENSEVVAYAFPVVGQGLWSTLYGYMAMEPDGLTVRGITFYKHGETPGLGGEIEKDWFQNNFKGKKIWSIKESKLTPIAVVKGRVADLYKGDESSHYVDGITAATLTGNGVTEMMDRWLKIYDPFLGKIRSEKGIAGSKR